MKTQRNGNRVAPHSQSLGAISRTASWNFPSFCERFLAEMPPDMRVNAGAPRKEVSSSHKFTWWRCLARRHRSIDWGWGKRVIDGIRSAIAALICWSPESQIGIGESRRNAHGVRNRVAPLGLFGGEVRDRLESQWTVGYEIALSVCVGGPPSRPSSVRWRPACTKRGTRRELAPSFIYAQPDFM